MDGMFEDVSTMMLKTLVNPSEHQVSDDGSETQTQKNAEPWTIRASSSDVNPEKKSSEYLPNHFSFQREDESKKYLGIGEPKTAEISQKTLGTHSLKVQPNPYLSEALFEQIQLKIQNKLQTSEFPDSNHGEFVSEKIRKNRNSKMVG